MFSGEGGLFVSGRWHQKGTPCVYTSQSLACAFCETLVHIADSKASKSLFSYGTLSVPEDLIHTPKNLPRNWNTIPHDPCTEVFGTNLIKQKIAVAYIFPSVIVPEELNALIDPFHPQFKHCTISPPRDLEIDPRLSKMFSSKYSKSN